MSMTKKDFKAIAEILATFGYSCDIYVVRELATYFKEVNPKFNRCKFMKAAGYPIE